MQDRNPLFFFCLLAVICGLASATVNGWDLQRDEADADASGRHEDLTEPTANAERRKPNVILVMTDEQNLRGLSCYRGTVCRTPTVDRMAEQGVLYENAYCVYPVCMPSRAACMTGRYPHRTGVRSNGISLPETEVHLPGVLREAGYVTALCGKNHCFRATSLNEVFDYVLSDFRCHFGVQQEIPSDFPPFAQEANEFYRNLRPKVRSAFGNAVIPFPPEVSDAGLFTEAALRFIREHRDSPFFLWLSYPGPHWPFTCPEGYERLFPPELVDLPPDDDLRTKPERQRAVPPILGVDKATEADWRKVISLYYGNCRNIDDQLRRVLELLDDLGIDEETIVIFTSDHGDYLGEHGLMHKSNAFYDCLTKIPYIWRWPGHIRSGRRRAELTENVDLMPTILDLCGVDIPPGVQGLSHARGLLGQGPFPNRDACFSECGIEGPPLRMADLDDLDLPEGPYDDWGSVGGEKYWQGRGRMVRDSRWKLCFYSNGDGELYDLQEDPWELDNLFGSGEHQEIVRRLKDRLLRWSVESEDALPLFGGKTNR